MHRRRHIAPIALALLAAPGGPALAGTVTGTVFVDADGDGRQGADEAPLEGATVWLETREAVQTDASGRFAFAMARAKDVVWVSTPSAFAPGHAWRFIASAANVEFEIGLRPAERSAPLTFVHVSDSHVGKKLFAGHGRIDALALRRSMNQAIDLEPAPSFVVMTGDLTNRETPAEIAEAASVLLDLGVPFVAVPGNHDWVSRGANYRPVFGPPSHSFDAGGVHFVVLNDNWRRPPDIAFLKRNLEVRRAHGQPDMPVVVFTHRPPEDHSLQQLESLGVDHLLTGHWHANRVLSHGALRQLNVEPIVRGGIDFTPAGYRVVTMNGGELTAVHRTVVDSAQAALVWPSPLGCVVQGPHRIIASVAATAREPQVSLLADGAEALAMRAVGGWAHVVDLTIERDTTLELRVTVGDREVASQRRSVRVCEAPPSAGRAIAWTQAQGGATHHGAVAVAIEPPLRPLWASAVGGSIYGGSAASEGDTLVVGVADLANGTRGGVVALDASTGRELWRTAGGRSVRGTPAIAAALVVYGTTDGQLIAVGIGDGEPVWSLDLGSGADNNRSAFIADPTIFDGTVYAAVLGRVVAVDLATGTVRWQDKRIAPTGKDLSTRASVTVFGDLVVATAGLGRDGLVAYDRATGKRRWTLPKKVTNGINGSPIAHEGRLWVTNAAGELRAIDADGTVAWTRKVVADGTGFSHSIAATPALADGILVVPSQYDSLIAVSARSGRKRWGLKVDRGAVHAAHNAIAARSVVGSPVVTGDTVWVAGVDGELRSADLRTGKPLWNAPMGAPVLAGLAPIGDRLIVAGFDGVVRAFVHDSNGPAIDRNDRSGVLFAALLLAIGALSFVAMRWRS